MTSTVLSLHIRPSTKARLPKRPISEAVVRISGIVGDYNHFRHKRKKDSPDRALLLLPEEVLLALNKEGWPVMPGDLGENVLVRGITYQELAPGLRLRVGEVEIELTEECAPCRTLRTLSYADAGFIKALTGRRGWFARIITPGIMRVGDVIKLRHSGPDARNSRRLGSTGSTARSPRRYRPSES